MKFGIRMEYKKRFNFRQRDAKDCGPTCLKIISKFHGKNIDINLLREICETTVEGSNLAKISEAAEKFGFRTLGAKINLKDLDEVPLPCILHWNKNHYLVLYKIKKNRYFISDPSFGYITYSKKEILKYWISDNANETTEEGIVLLMEPTPKFHQENFNESGEKLDFSFLASYILRYKPFLVQLIIGLLAGSLLQLIFPFLTQSIVDVGIKNQDINFIYLILIGQLVIFIGRLSIEIIRSWILLHLSTRINISLLSDFFIKLMNLPISYFDTRLTGDIMQRINDHQRIERILTSSSLSLLFSLFNLFIFGAVLFYYSYQIFSVFLTGSLVYFIWIWMFMKKRKILDYKRFAHTSREQSKVIELINGMQEIKLHNAERKKRWSWEYLQASLFKLSIEGLKLEQFQSVGSQFINELKNILITVLAARLVITGEITLGMMLAISYIVGQLNSPISQLISFIRRVQDARISLDRLAEIHNRENEEKDPFNIISEIPEEKDFTLTNVAFKYKGTKNKILKNLNIVIPQNKVTAIVGVSGSGKTTLIKLLLKFYSPTKGQIKIGNTNLENISPKVWRKNCGVVMQDGYIFNDTIANNIALGESHIDKNKLKHAAKIANILDYIETLPLSFKTKIGMEGLGLSSGQKQRILIARAVYKNPNYIFFDEATSALDANNEKQIIENLNVFFKDRTVVVVAHRLSTVKNAHQILVLDQGEIIEWGAHSELVKNRGAYFELIQNQLELGV